MKAISNITCPPPVRRIEKLKHFSNRMQEADTVTIMKDWGMVLSKEMVELQGHVLPPPQVTFKGRTVAVQKADWNFSMTGNVMYTTIPLSNWHVIYRPDARSKMDQSNVEQLVKLIISSVSRMGMTIQRPQM